MLTYNHMTRSVFLPLFVFLSGILFTESQLAAAHSRTDNILSLSVDTARNGNQTGYRNSLLGYEILYPEDWMLHESVSMGYPYISIIDPVAQAYPPDTAELHQGALIEISAEEYLLQVPVGEYLKSFFPFNVSRIEPLSTLESEELVSYAWGVEGVSVIFTDDDLHYYNHATLVDYAESKLLLQIRLTVFHASFEQEQVYLDTFNQILASLNFSPPPAMPQPATSASEAPSDSVQFDLAGATAKQFLTLPFKSTSNMSVVQGWVYTGGGIHAGIDYKKSTWKPFDVVAAADGEACGNCVYGPGNKVWIKHTLGKMVYYSYYGHLATIEPGIPLWNPGSTVRVTRGQKIGTAGNTGTRYIHLHFGVYNASWVEIDPYDLYTTSSAYYPNLTYQSMGANHLFTHDPPFYPSQAETHLPISAYLPLILRR